MVRGLVLDHGDPLSLDALAKEGVMALRRAA